jgi:hypothetical protein
MEFNPSYSASIFESLGVISGFNVAESIWEKYEKFAICKVKESTIKIRGSLYYVKEFSPARVERELNSIRPILLVLGKLRSKIKNNNDPDLIEFKRAVMDFFETVDVLCQSLEDLATSNSEFELSKPVLAVDWDSKEDDHWDNY